MQEESQKTTLRLCRSEENFLKQDIVLNLGTKAGCNCVGNLDGLGERDGTGIMIWRGKESGRGLEHLG